jgi:anthrone oxygenase-like protein
MMFALVAVICAGVFAGAAVYITFVEHPARLSCSTEIAVTEFRPSYRRGTVMQASLAVLGLIASVLAFALGGGVPVLVAGLLFGSVVPFTLLVIFPTNKKLLDPALDLASSDARTLLIRWGRLHAVRTAVSSLAFGLFLAHILSA